MFLHVLKSKIHRATVTDADLHYVGSVTIDRDLMDAARLIPGEKVQIVNISNGSRLETYVIEGKPGSGAIGINGAAAHLVSKGDLVIIMCYAMMEETEALTYKPHVVHVDGSNTMIKLGNDPSEAVSPGSKTPPDALNG